tara:strand:+ start:108 stop:974 length:867 start_codon:yes stop_codon:yes gene_type:complete
MAVATAATIQAHLIGATYPEGTLDSNNIFDYAQYTTRRRYPSCEVLTTQPESTVETKRSTDTTIAFEINYFDKNLGLRTDDVSTQREVENVIMARMETMVLQDHKIVMESKSWTRQSVQRDGSHPAYLVSTLKIMVREITKSSLTLDGVLAIQEIDGVSAAITFDCFDTTIDEGFRQISEQVADNPSLKLVGVHYPGGFSGTFMTNIVVKAADIGTATQDLNQLIALNGNGFQKEIKLQYTDKTNITVPDTITEVVYINATSLQRLYRFNDNTVFRLLGQLTKPSTIS